MRPELALRGWSPSVAGRYFCTLRALFAVPSVVLRPVPPRKTSLCAENASCHQLLTNASLGQLPQRPTSQHTIHTLKLFTRWAFKCHECLHWSREGSRHHNAESGSPGGAQAGGLCPMRGRAELDPVDLARLWLDLGRAFDVLRVRSPIRLEPHARRTTCHESATKKGR